jgi:hypothetical protein
VSPSVKLTQRKPARSAALVARRVSTKISTYAHTCAFTVGLCSTGTITLPSTTFLTEGLDGAHVKLPTRVRSVRLLRRSPRISAWGVVTQISVHTERVPAYSQPSQRISVLYRCIGLATRCVLELRRSKAGSRPSGRDFMALLRDASNWQRRAKLSLFPPRHDDIGWVQLRVVIVSFHIKSGQSVHIWRAASWLSKVQYSLGFDII